MCSSLLDFPLGVLSVVGEETVSAALHQHGEFDSDRPHQTSTSSLTCFFFLTVQRLLTSSNMWILNVVFAE